MHDVVILLYDVIIAKQASYYHVIVAFFRILYLFIEYCRMSKSFYTFVWATRLIFAVFNNAL